MKRKWKSAIGALVIGISMFNFGSYTLAADEPVRDVENLFPYPDGELTLINHRGLSPSMPENTLAAFRNSVAMGVDVIEIDLRPTKDGEIVILHDATVDRTTNGTGAVKDMTLADVKQLDAGSYAGEQFAGEQIPTYAEVLETVKGTNVRLLLDIKDSSQVWQIVQVTEHYDMIDQVIVGPRSVDALKEFKALNPDLTTLGFISTMSDADAFINASVDYIRQWPDWILASRDDASCQANYAERVAAYEREERSHPGSASCVVEEVVSRGVPVWSTTNDMGYEGMDELLQLGATGLLSDVPEVLDQLLEDIEKKRFVTADEKLESLSQKLDDKRGAHHLYIRANQIVGKYVDAGNAKRACESLDVLTITTDRAKLEDVIKDRYLLDIEDIETTLACSRF
ncbi:glycerophosphodiester phosphodiesterase family protein [Niallia oryzisoli]|uniref:Glycerophosphodiester phosphodiesterase family protein n=1 Tax=Niallia oryzisoli TaxID=1737571 RepID=A0ABZ2CF72_9BACI